MRPSLESTFEKGYGSAGSRAKKGNQDDEKIRKV